MGQSRILIAAPKSGSGKTLVTIGLLRAFKDRGLKVSSFKCGPDYIDPLFHRAVLQVPAGNLDPFFSDAGQLRQILAEESAGADISVLEGVMGYYDGLGASSVEASTYDVAKKTKTPVIFVIDAGGAGLSNLALLSGFFHFVQDSGICGVLMNRCSENVFRMLKEKVEEAYPIPVLGYLPRLKEEEIPSRHLGLFLPNEIEGLSQKVGKIAAQMEETVDLDGILELACKAGKLEKAGGPAEQMQPGQAPEEAGASAVGPGNLSEKPEHPAENKERLPVRIAVARDEAFCFYYRENISLLEKLGARIVEFSPLRDHSLPEGCSGLILGGGYPELHTRQLSENTPMLEAVRRAVKEDMPVWAECGGFLYLQAQLQNPEGEKWPMAGVLDAEGLKSDKLSHFGYVQLTARQDTLLLKKGGTIRGHEFHYWKSTFDGDAFLEEKPVGTRHWTGGIAKGNLLAGFPHFYLSSAPEAAERFLDVCRQFAARQKAGI